MVANLRLDISVAPNKHPGHDILGHVGLHLARIDMLDQHQHHQGHIEGDIPRQARSTIDVFAMLAPVTGHRFGDRLPGQSPFQQ
jgi:hypothetical protein